MKKWHHLVEASDPLESWMRIFVQFPNSAISDSIPLNRKDLLRSIIFSDSMATYARKLVDEIKKRREEPEEEEPEWKSSLPKHKFGKMDLSTAINSMYSSVPPEIAKERAQYHKVEERIIKQFRKLHSSLRSVDLISLDGGSDSISFVFSMRATRKEVENLARTLVNKLQSRSTVYADEHLIPKSKVGPGVVNGLVPGDIDVIYGTGFEYSTLRGSWKEDSRQKEFIAYEKEERRREEEEDD